MALHRLCVCLLSWSGSWAQDLWVSQPGSVQGTEGGSVTLPCSYNSTREPRLGSYTWVKEVAGARLELSDGTQEFRGRVSRAQDQSFLRERRADVELRELRPYDTGTYRCLVKIPTLGEGAGNGTWLQVLKAGPPSSPPLALGTLGLGLGAGTAVGVAGAAAALVLICHKRRRDQREVGPQMEAPMPVRPRCPEPSYAELRVKPGRRPAPAGELVTYAAIGGSLRG
ncbi:natural cytotoxicity triggering receptor 3 [Malaclemys terrapin pileata]|uniref:natural cytotoxicity triggering receptor 3 n=1 Tax=Malaclemys terrapin pileata TaxID=2991368 RepID=UPI0023A8FEB7|nr:natural cytotoxicity triggering receptor 3 [Malaclemys terrapin pileata]